MSAVAALYNVPSTPEEWASWSFAHMAHHHDINRRIYELVGVQLPDFVLDPFDQAAAQTWLANHQIMHVNMDTILGISPFALNDVSFKNIEQTAGWVFLNATEHKLAADTLGMG